MSRAEPTGQQNTTQYVVSQKTSSSRKKHQPHPESTPDDPAPACQTVVQSSGWQLKHERNCIFYDDCTRCFPQGGDDA